MHRRDKSNWTDNDTLAMNPLNHQLLSANPRPLWSSPKKAMLKYFPARRDAPRLSQPFQSSAVGAALQACLTKSSSCWATMILVSRVDSTSASTSPATDSWQWSTQSATSPSLGLLTGTPAWWVGTSSPCSVASSRARACSQSSRGQSCRCTGRTGQSSTPTSKPLVRWKLISTSTLSLEENTASTTNARVEDRLSRSTPLNKSSTKWNRWVAIEGTILVRFWLHRSRFFLAVLISL